MKKYKRHIIIGSIIIAVLVFAFWWGGDAPSLRGWNIEPTPKATERVVIDEVYDNDESPTPTVEPTISPTSSPAAENSEKIQNKPTADKPMTAEKKIELAEEIAGEPYEEIYTPDLEYSENNGMNIDESTGTDEYKTGKDRRYPGISGRTPPARTVFMWIFHGNPEYAGEFQGEAG